ncbi:MAG: type I restriction enzyme HsdR N-terminal domain-containing protein [Bacteroidaceae bacterium]|nr:type I restriction enzyme HsdR N-terminal domain-containing protein [Bacteroidaceae bacterium]
MLTLNLPEAPLRLVCRKDRTMVFDILRHRYITLTPEEWVRQHFVHFLIAHKGYPAALLGNEISLALGDTKKRCDSVLYDTQVRPRMIIEYKAPHIELTQKVFDQISRYNIALKVDYLIVSNGLTHYCCHVDYAAGTYTFLPDIPDYCNL